MANMENSVIDLCNNLNKAIHEPLYHNFYNIPDELKYNQTFTSIDLIEDCQIAIEEFEKTKSDGKPGRSTLIPGLPALPPRCLGLRSKCLLPFSECRKNKSSLSTIPSKPAGDTTENPVNNLCLQSKDVCTEIPVSFALLRML
jgi:hypothetical protein